MAEQILQKISYELERAETFGFMSASVYDTAWVSMITRTEGDRKIWAFPQCFDYILDTQLENGTWPQYRSPVDAILNSLASLYALIVHKERCLSTLDGTQSILDRIEKARHAVKHLLESWDINECVHVGFEILVPSLLQRLERFGVYFEFTGAALLNSLFERKSAKFRPEMLYGSHQTTLLHSLEAFIDTIDFERIRHHQINGSFLGSPSSTAAYLIATSEEPEESEAFSFVSACLKAAGNVAVPSAFPSPIFEVTWAVSTLLSIQPLARSIDTDHLQKIGSWLEEVFVSQKGLLGFAPSYLPDADDTAKCIYVLNCLGKEPDLRALVDEFSTGTYFRTYRFETNPSFSANCNVLLAMLTHQQSSAYTEQIVKAIAFLLEQWEQGPVRDKWNLSEDYSLMLLTQVLVTFVERWDSKCLSRELADPVITRVPTTLIQILRQCVASQQSDGSWSSCLEVTAYAVLTLSYALRLCWSPPTRSRLVATFEEGQKYLVSHGTVQSYLQHVWVEKVSYSSPLLAEAYCTAASSAKSDKLHWSNEVRELFDVSSAQTHDGFEDRPSALASVPSFFTSEFGVLDEAKFTSRRLNSSIAESIRPDLIADDLITSAVVTSWIISNPSDSSQLPRKIQQEMIMLSLLSHQINQYLGSKINNIPSAWATTLETIIRDHCSGASDLSRELNSKSVLAARDTDRLTQSPPTPPSIAESPLTYLASMQETIELLQRYIRFIHLHPAFIGLSDDIRQTISADLQTYLLSWLQDTLDHKPNDVSLPSRPILEHAEPKQHNLGESYSRASRFNLAAKTGIPLLYTLYCCLISPHPDKHLFETRSRYYGETISYHLASTYQQSSYFRLRQDSRSGDGSVLNSSEFKTANGKIEAGLDPVGGQAAPHGSSGKDDLEDILSFERSCVQAALDKFQEYTGPKSAALLQIFVNVFDK